MNKEAKRSVFNNKPEGSLWKDKKVNPYSLLYTSSDELPNCDEDLVNEYPGEANSESEREEVTGFIREYRSCANEIANGPHALGKGSQDGCVLDLRLARAPAHGFGRH